MRRFRRSRSSRSERAGRADASVPAGELRLHGHQLADPSRRVHLPAACWAGRCGRRRRPSRRWPPDLHPDLTTRERVALQTKPAGVPDLPRDDQPARLSRWSTSTPSAASATEEKGKPIDAERRLSTRRPASVVKFSGRPRPGRRSWPTARKRTPPSSSSCSTTWSSSRSGPTAPTTLPRAAEVVCRERISTSASWWSRSWPSRR